MDYYSPQGEPISVVEWTALFSDRGPDSEWAKHHILDEVGAEYQISTVWIGMDYQIYGNSSENKLIFETMVFGPTDEEDCVRCGSWEEAKVIHMELFKKYFTKYSNKES